MTEEEKFESNSLRRGSVKKVKPPEEEQGLPRSSGFIYVLGPLGRGRGGGGAGFQLSLEHNGSNQLANKQQSHEERVSPSGLQEQPDASTRL